MRHFKNWIKALLYVPIGFLIYYLVKFDYLIIGEVKFDYSLLIPSVILLWLGFFIVL
jgi:hypothetical protein